MNESTTQNVDINLKDLLCFILKHTKALIIIAFIFGIAGFGYSAYNQKKSASTPSVSVLDTTQMLPGESEEEYSNRVANVERANAIMDNIATLTSQVDIQNKYLCDSVYMQIDPLNVATSRLQIVIACDNDIVGGIESIYNAYSVDITKGDYLDSVADELDYSTGAVQELIGVNLTSTYLTYSDSQEQIGTLNIMVVGPSIDETELIMDAVIAEIDSIYPELNSSVTQHTLSIVGRQCSIGYDATVKKNQFDAVTTLNTIQNQINNLNNNLDSIAKTLGMTDRADFYVSAISVNNSFSIKTCIKYSLVGLVFGLVLVAGILVLLYLFGRRIVSQAQFFSLFRGIDCIGVCKPSGKSNRLQSALDRWSSDNNSMSEESTNSIISANFGNLTIGVNRVLVTGTVDSESVRESIKKLGITGDVKLNMFSDLTVLPAASKYDGIVLIEKRGVSEKKLVKEQINLLKNSGTKIIGAIIL